MADKCIRCGTEYTGWNCPTCAHREQVEQEARDQAKAQRALLETQRETAESAAQLQRELFDAQAQADADRAEDMKRVLEEQTERQAEAQREAIADSWKLKADSMVNRGMQLVDAGLYQEAVSLASRALSEDPGNIGAYLCAVKAHKGLGNIHDMRALVSKQVSLLRTDEYRDEAGAFRMVAAWCRDDADNLKHFAATLQESARRRAFRSDIEWTSINVLDRLRGTPYERLAHDIARDTFTTDDLRPSTLMLVAAYMIDLSESPTKDLATIATHLAKMPFANRHALASACTAVTESKRFASDTTSALAGLLQIQLDAWKPEVETEIEAAAAAVAEKVPRPTSGRLLGWAVGIGLWFSIALLEEFFVRMGPHPNATPRPFNMIGVTLGLIAGCVVTHVIRSSRHAKAMREQHESVRQERTAREDISI